MDSYLDTVDSDWYRQRASGALICVLAAFFILLVRLYYLQIIEGDEFRRLSENNCARLQGIPPARGLIFDRNGVLMVENRPCFNVSIVPGEAKDSKRVVFKLAELLGVAPESLFTKLIEARRVPSFKPILLRRDVSRDAVAIIEAHKLDLPGVLITVDPMRHYIEGSRGSHLIGYLSEISSEELKSGCFPDNRVGDFVGKFGVEKAYEPYLHGKRGKQQIEVNALGQITRVLKTEEAVSGKNIYLTLDVGLQRKAEALLAGKVGTAVAMDPSNGHILAMASSPAFDPNAFVEGMTYDSWNDLTSNQFRPMENKAIQGQYPPGSIYKIVTAMAGLEEGVITEQTRIFCPGYYRYGDRTFRCWKRGGHGFMNVIDALAQSCDVFFYQVGEKLGVDRLAKYAKACGLGSPTGIVLDREARGLVPTSRWKLSRLGMLWQGGETLSVAIGQGFNLVTPIQMLSLISAVANGGTRYKPLVVRRIESSDGSLVKEQVPVPIGRLPASEKTLQIIMKGLLNAVNKPTGTGWNAHIPGVNVAGKTGTAQVVGMEEDNEKKSVESQRLDFRDHSWFISFAPAEDPRIAVTVLVEHGGHGSRTAAPLSREMIKAYLKNDLELASSSAEFDLALAQLE
ncbi:MAG: penicillin-binding protein 2 [Deltaproteobacteria bacterium]|mgnify:CR=1 FL=1|nr:MAG: penicillin-binding protein 2 [Deltaproteobacteria bacterium]